MLQVADYAVFGVVLLSSWVIGAFYFVQDHKKSKSTASKADELYFLGNKRLKFWPTTVSIFASFVSAIALVGIPAELYEYGAGVFIFSLASALGAVCAALTMVPVLYRLDLLSSYAYIEMRYGSSFLRRIGSVNNILCAIMYLSGVTMAPCVALEAVSSIPMWVSVVAISIITLFYSVLGGMKAIVLVDLIQAVLMLGGVIAAIVIGFLKIDGGMARAFSVAADEGRLNFFTMNPDPRNYHSFYALFFPAFFSFWGLYGTSQGSVQRYSGLPTLRQAVWSIIAVNPQIILFNVTLLLLAAAMYAHYSILGCDPLKSETISSPNQLTTYYITEVIAPSIPGLTGLWFAALFSGSLSTMSTGYNSIAANIWDDLIKPTQTGQNLTSHQSSILQKVLSMVVGIVVLVFAILFRHIPGSAIRLLMSTATVFECASYIPFFCGLFMPWTNSSGVIIGILSGVIVTGTLSIGQLMGYGDFRGNALPLNIDNCTSLTTNASITSSIYANATIGNSETTLLHDLFSITPYYYALIELLIGCAVAALASFITAHFVERFVAPPETLASCFSRCEEETYDNVPLSSKGRNEDQKQRVALISPRSFEGHPQG